MTTCESETGALRQKSSFIGNCPVMSAVQRVPPYLAKQNVCFIFGMLKEMNGLWSECGSLKHTFIFLDLHT